MLFKIQYILNFSLKSREYCLCDAIMTHKLNSHSPYFFSNNIYTKDRPFTWKLFTKIILYKLVILFKIQYILNFLLKSREYCLCDAIMTRKLNFHSTYFFSTIFILRTVHLHENNLLRLFCISWLFFLKYSIFWIFHWNPGNIVFAMPSWLINLNSIPHIFFP